MLGLEPETVRLIVGAIIFFTLGFFAGTLINAADEDKD